MWKAIKDFLTSALVKSYAGSWVRGLLRFLSGMLVAHGLANADVAAALEGSLFTVIMNILQLVATNPEAVAGLVSAAIAQLWSLKEKKTAVNKLEAVEGQNGKL